MHFGEAEEQRTENQNSHRDEHHHRRKEPQVLLSLRQGPARECLLHIVLIEPGHDHREGCATDELLPEETGRSPVPVENSGLRTAGQIEHQVRRTPAQAHHQGSDAQKDPEDQEAALEKVGPHQRLDSASKRINQDEQDGRSSRHPERNTPALKDERLEDRNSQVKSCG